MAVNIFKFAWKNIQRNRRRTALTVLAIVIGMVSLIFGKSYIAGMMTSITEPIIMMQSGHVRIAHPEFLRMQRVIPREKYVSSLGNIRQILNTFPDIHSVTQLIRFPALAVAGNENENCLTVGVVPEEAAVSMEMDSFVIQGNYLNKNRNQVIIGVKLAKKLNLTVGSELLLVTSDINYSTYALPFLVCGIFEIGVSAFDKNGVFVHFDKAAEMLDYRDAFQEILVHVKHPKKAPVLAAEIKNRITGLAAAPVDVVPWQENDVLKKTMPLIEKVWGGILYLMMFIVALVILNTMLMAVMERYSEIGIIKALGFKNRDVMAMIFAEAFYIGSLGSVLGAVLGSVLTGIIGRTGISIFQGMSENLVDSMDLPLNLIGKALYPEMSVSIIAGSVILGIATTLVAVVYPAVRSASMLPVEAFRAELKV